MFILKLRGLGHFRDLKVYSETLNLVTEEGLIFSVQMAYFVELASEQSGWSERGLILRGLTAEKPRLPFLREFSHTDEELSLMYYT